MTIKHLRLFYFHQGFLRPADPLAYNPNRNTLLLKRHAQHCAAQTSFRVAMWDVEAKDNLYERRESDTLEAACQQ